MADAITRVGLAAKRGLTAASDVLAELASWLEARGVTPVFETDTARLVGLSSPARRTVARDRLPHECDLLIVLGGDGTLIGMAGLIAVSGSDVPILGVNYGSLGFLTEITLPELFGARTRFTQLALAKEIGGILATAIGPVLAATLTAVTGQWWPLAVMIVGYSGITLVSAVIAPEVRGRDLVRLEDAA